MKAEPPTVLVVDDDSAVAASLALLLRQSGYRPVAAATPEAALARLSEGGIGLVLSDMNFRRGTTGEEGLALLAAIRSGHPGLPVVLMTGYASQLHEASARRFTVLSKPCQPEVLIAALRGALQSRRSAGVDGPARHAAS